MTDPPTVADLMADPGELDVSCLDCHHNTTMPVATVLPRYAAETPFPEVWGGFRCSACEVCGRSAELGGPSGGRADNPAIAVWNGCRAELEQARRPWRRLVGWCVALRVTACHGIVSQAVTHHRPGRWRLNGVVFGHDPKRTLIGVLAPARINPIPAVRGITWPTKST